MNRLVYIDVLRVFAAATVLYTHLFDVAGNSPAVPEAVSSDIPMPLFPGTSHWLWNINLWSLNFGTLPAILGVTLFFVITGFLMAGMMARYDRLGFAVNRIFRIWPPLVACLALIGIFLGVTEGIHFSAKQYFFSSFLIHEATGVVPVVSLLWTLVVEAVFYAICLLVGVFTQRKVWLLSIACLVCVYLWHQWPDILALHLLAIYAQSVLVILIGTTIFLSAKQTGETAVLSIVLSVSAAYFGISMTGTARAMSPYYASAGTIILATLLFLSARRFATAPAMIVVAKVLKPVANVVYPLYLLNVAIGIGTMAIARPYIHSTLGLIAMGLFATLVGAFLVHYSVERPAIGLGRRVSARLRGRGNGRAKPSDPSTVAVS
jgi:peptidoglycan/LPS O-acetylase OafA/YrhL